MDRRVRLAGIGAVIVTALLATLLLTPPEGSLSVDDVMDDPDQRKGDTISVRGVVENGSFDTQAGIFALSGESSILSVKIGAAQL